jgi:hypothetical protein
MKICIFVLALTLALCCDKFLCGTINNDDKTGEDRICSQRIDSEAVLIDSKACEEGFICGLASPWAPRDDSEGGIPE